MKISRGDLITWKPEFREKGDEDLLHVVMDEPSQYGAVRVKCFGTGLFVNPISLVRAECIESTVPMDVWLQDPKLRAKIGEHKSFLLNT